MILHDVEQGSRQWEALRLGLPTCSAFDRLLTPKTRRLSAQAPTYRNQLLAEWLLGYSVEWNPANDWMLRGLELEPEARRYYEFERDAEVTRVGFVTRDDGKVGGSPDGLIGEDGGLEIKCPAIHTHIGYMLGDGPDYTGQVQGYMYLTGRQWWDVMSYNPDLPPVIVRVERDEEYIAALDAALAEFTADLEACKERLAEHKRAPLEAVA